MQKLLIGMGLSLTACGPVVSCVARGARVQTPRGGRSIEDLRVGDEVVVANPATGLTVVSHITAITSATRECGSLEIGGRTLKLTSDHPVYDPLAKGFFPAGDWLLGDRKHLLEIGDDGPRVVQVDGAKLFCAVSEVFDLTVEHEWHTFVAEDIVVHNKQPAGCRVPDAGVTTSITIPDDERPTCSCGDAGIGRWTCAGSGGVATCELCGTVDAGVP